MVTRSGFGLVEVIVAITLIGIGVMSVAGSAAFANRTLQNAEDQEAAAQLAANVLDSLSYAVPVIAGTRADGRLTARWTPTGADSVRVDIIRTDSPDDSVVVMHAATRAATLLSLPLPPSLAPPADPAAST
jgi:prepilin-type N-terminal cleavage/methylation domain-containing protein